MFVELLDKLLIMENVMGKLQGKVAIVTGASKGIGAAIAKAYAEEGAAVVVNYASSRAGADKVVSEITGKGGKAVAVGGNVAKAADVKVLFEETKKNFGRLDVLVNNAGVFNFFPIDNFTEEEYRRQFDTNVLGPFLTTKESLSYFGPEGGSIINVSSVVAFAPPPASSVYSATKAALDNITRVLAGELGPRKIRVNSLNPGGVETEGTHSAGIIGSDFEKEMAKRAALGRIGQPDDIAKVAVFLASGDAGWITGDRVTASGGYA
jgi:3-oxoacyl-[acyl-carrier protein] reductase